MKYMLIYVVRWHLLPAHERAELLLAQALDRAGDSADLDHRRLVAGLVHVVHHAPVEGVYQRAVYEQREHVRIQHRVLRRKDSLGLRAYSPVVRAGAERRDVFSQRQEGLVEAELLRPAGPPRPVPHLLPPPLPQEPVRDVLAVHSHCGEHERKRRHEVGPEVREARLQDPPEPLRHVSDGSPEHGVPLDAPLKAREVVRRVHGHDPAPLGPGQRYAEGLRLFERQVYPQRHADRVPPGYPPAVCVCDHGGQPVDLGQGVRAVGPGLRAEGPQVGREPHEQVLAADHDSLPLELVEPAELGGVSLQVRRACPPLLENAGEQLDYPPGGLPDCVQVGQGVLQVKREGQRVAPDAVEAVSERSGDLLLAGHCQRRGRLGVRPEDPAGEPARKQPGKHAPLQTRRAVCAHLNYSQCSHSPQLLRAVPPPRSLYKLFHIPPWRTSALPLH